MTSPSVVNQSELGDAHGDLERFVVAPLVRFTGIPQMPGVKAVPAQPEIGPRSRRNRFTRRLGWSALKGSCLSVVPLHIQPLVFKYLCSRFETPESFPRPAPIQS